jgi:hypothetical protein
MFITGGGGTDSYSMRGGYHIDRDNRIKTSIIPIGLHHHVDYGDHEEDLDETPIDEFNADYQENAPIIQERVFNEMYIIVIPKKSKRATKKRRAKRA